MAEENIFADEWRDCLRAHYQHVIRTGDQVTEPSLRVVMHQAGFDDSELAELRVRATMHVDDTDADFVPDMDVLEAPSEAIEPPVFPATMPPALPEEADIPPLEDEVVLEEEFFTEPESVEDAPPEDDDPDAPAQLSLF
ncbi:MAG: hypothetical protein H6672_12575 [Anaerolineaceae bacterium]|nr:hypothetical protein [Anaerolineaceae bacterium]